MLPNPLWEVYCILKSIKYLQWGIIAHVENLRLKLYMVKTQRNHLMQQLFRLYSRLQFLNFEILLNLTKNV